MGDQIHYTVGSDYVSRNPIAISDVEGLTVVLENHATALSLQLIRIQGLERRQVRLLNIVTGILAGFVAAIGVEVAFLVMH